METDFNYIQGRVRLYATGTGNSISKELTVFPHKVDEVQLQSLIRTEPIVLSQYRTGNFIDLFNQSCLIPVGDNTFKRTIAERIVCTDLQLVYEAEVDGTRYFQYIGNYFGRVKKRPKHLPEKVVEPVLAKRITERVTEQIRNNIPYRKEATVDIADPPRPSAGCFDGLLFSFSWIWRLTAIALLWLTAAATGYSMWFTLLALLLAIGLILTFFSKADSGSRNGWMFPIGMTLLGITFSGWSAAVFFSVLFSTILFYLFYNGNGLIRSLIAILSVLFCVNILLGLNTDAWRKWKEEYVEVPDEDILPEQKRTVVVDSTNAEGDIIKRELVEHFLKWKDNSMSRFSGTYRVYADDAGRAQVIRNRYSTDLSTASGWGRLYRKMQKTDNQAVGMLVEEFNRIKKEKSLNKRQTLEMVVTSVQSIPYYLVHEGTCQVASARDQFMSDYHASRRPCLPLIKHGLQSPSEFAEDLKGDCDTRSLFLYQILTQMGYDAAVLISFQYGHSMLGVNMPTKGGCIKHRGKKYYLWETTAKNWKLGQVPPNYSNLRYWNVALN